MSRSTHTPLLIVESPSKAKTIEKYLGGQYVVRASVGHIRDLPTSNKKAIDIPGGFVPHYEISKGKEKIVKELSMLAKDAPLILLATDPDREGEAISWHLLEILKQAKTKAPIKRVTFNEITKNAIEEALKHPRTIDEDLVRAQEARRVLDRLVGYDLSGVIWKKVRYGLSAGRVQSPALRIIMEREREIRAFIPTTYWTLTATLSTATMRETPFVAGDTYTDRDFVQRVLDHGRSNQWQVIHVGASEQKRVPKAPFTTSTLQQTASSRLGFSPSRTMQVAQKLYENGLITYMRTDSTSLSKEAQADILATITKEYGATYAEARAYKTKSKNAQEAHEAIRPTHMSEKHGGTTEEQKRLYRLIRERTLASQMTDARVLRSKISASLDQKGLTSWDHVEAFPVFAITGSQVLFDGWLRADPDARGEDVELPPLAQGQTLNLQELLDTEKQTEPPHRYTEAGLVKELETRGIGRPSTYASIIRTLEDREYVTKNGRTLLPTDTGDVVSSFLEEHFASYISDTFTADMEDKLDDIASGTRTYKKTLQEFYGPFTIEVKAKDKLDKATTLEDAPSDMLCPLCGERMVVKLGRSGKFYSCHRYPDCDGARTLEGKALEGPKETGEACPLCAEKHEGKLVVREGRFGSFISCSRYPKCKFIKQDEEELKKKMTDVTCPMCNDGKMMERRGRFGIFYSCSKYPDCKNAIKTKPTGALCNHCGALMMEGTKTIPERCSDKKCPNHNPHKLAKQ